MRFFEVDSAVDAIMGAAMVAQGRASQLNKQGKLSMNGFLQMLANSGIMMDYDGFKTVFDTNPALQNVIAKFDKDTITFKGDSDDEGEGYEEPETDMPDDERVAKMAKRAMKTREFVEGYSILPSIDRNKYQERDGLEGPIMTRSGKVVYYDPEEGKYYDPDTDMYMTYDEWKAYDPELPIKSEATLNEDDVQALMRQLMRKDGIDPDKVSDGGIFDKYRAMARKQLGLDEDKLPPHLAKMFGKDGRQVDTRTDVMRQMRDIVANKSASKVKFGDGDQMIDMYTASVLTQIYDKVNDNSKEAIIQRIGTIEKFNKLMPKLFNMISKNESVSESVKENAKQRLDEFAPLAALAAGAVRLGAAALRTGGMAAARRLAGAASRSAGAAMGAASAAAVSGDSDSGDSDSVSGYDLGKKIAQATEGNSPHKKGTKKYKAHMAAMHAGESVGEAWQAFKERSLTSAEKDKMKHYEKKLPKQDFIDRYGKKEGEAIYYATATKMAKKNA